MLIPVGMNYQAEKSGHVIRNVQCEACHTEYVYLYKATGSASEDSIFFFNTHSTEAKAKRLAEQEFERKLAKGYRVVPCLACGHIQLHMIERARKQYRRRYVFVNKCLLFSLIVLAGIGAMCVASGLPIRAIVTAIIAILVIVAIVIIDTLGEKYTARYDPNSIAEKLKRKDIRQENAMLRSDYESSIAERVKQREDDKRLLQESQLQLDEVPQQTELDNQLWRNYQREAGRQTITVAKPVQALQAPNTLAEMIDTLGESDSPGRKLIPANSGVCQLHCVHCDTDYVYFLKPSERSPRRNMSHVSLRKKEERSSTNRQKQIVPCPNCNHIQPDMVEELRDEFYSTFVIFSYLIGSVIVVFFFATIIKNKIKNLPLTLGVIAVTVIIAILIPSLARWLAKRRDPNAHPDITQCKYSYYETMPKSQYDQLMQEDAAWKQPEPEFNVDLAEPTEPRQF